MDSVSEHQIIVVFLERANIHGKRESSTHLRGLGLKFQLSNHYQGIILYFLQILPLPPGGSGGKESACNVGDPGSIPGS